MPPSFKGKKGGNDKDKIPVASLQQLLEELKAFKAALLVKETEHTWEALDRAVKRFTAVTRGGGYHYEAEYVAGLKDRELARAIVGTLSTERTQLSASTLLFLSAATRLGQAFAPLLFLYFPHIIRLLSRTNRLYISRATACLTVIIGNTRLAGVIPYLREGMLEKSPTHRKGCMAGLLYTLGGPDPLATSSNSSVYEGTLVDKDTLRRRYLEDVETSIRIGARDRDIEVRKIAKRCWEIYRSEFSERVVSFAGPLTPIARKYLELPPMGQAVPDYSQEPFDSRTSEAHVPIVKSVRSCPASGTSRPNALPAPPRGPPPTKPPSIHDTTIHTVHRMPTREVMPPIATASHANTPQAGLGILPQPLLRSSTNQGPPRPPPTLSARRVLPPSTAVPNSRPAETMELVPTSHWTTFKNQEPVASTSYAPAAPILSRSLSSGATKHHILSHSSHHRAITANLGPHTSDTRQVGRSDAEACERRPASVCSISSSVASSTRSPSKEPFRPNSSNSFRSKDEQEDEKVHSCGPGLDHLDAPSALVITSRPEVPHQRRVVPAHVNKAPTRATRRASRMLPPSTDLQAFLSSTAIAAASDFKWPLSASVTASEPPLPEPVVIPVKRPASAMRPVHSSSNTAACVYVERNDSPNGIPSQTRAEGIVIKQAEAVDVVTEAVVVSSSSSLVGTSGDPEPDQKSTAEPAQQLDAVALAPENTVRDEESTERTSQKNPAGQLFSSGSGIVDDYAQTLEPICNDTNSETAPEASQMKPVLPMACIKMDEPSIEEAGTTETFDKVFKAFGQEPEFATRTHPSDEQEQPQAEPSTSATDVTKNTGPAIDTVALAAHLPLGAGPISGETTLPLLAGTRKKTAFRPQKHNKPAEKPPTWMALPASTSGKTATDLRPSQPALDNSAGSHVNPVTIAFPSEQPRSSSLLQQAPKSSITQGPLRPAAAQTAYPVRSVSASSSIQPMNRRVVSASLGRSHPVRAARVDQPAPAASRDVQTTKNNKPPPTKKQALSSSTGPRAAQPILGGAFSRGRRSPNRPIVSTSISHRPASKSGTARQGSIFSRLAAPTAASAGKVKPRIQSDTKETFKKPLPSSGSIAKKSSTVSSNNSQECADRLPRNLDDASKQGSDQHQASTHVDGRSTGSRPDTPLEDLDTQNSAHNKSTAAPTKLLPAGSPVTDVMETGHSSELQRQSDSAAEYVQKCRDKPQSSLSSTSPPSPVSGTIEPLHAAVCIPLPASPSTLSAAEELHQKSNSVLAELGVYSVRAYSANNPPSQEKRLVDDKSFSGSGAEAVLSTSVAEYNVTSRLNRHSEPDNGQEVAAECLIAEYVPSTEAKAQLESLESVPDDKSVADATVIVHSLDELDLDDGTSADIANGHAEASGKKPTLANTDAERTMAGSSVETNLKDDMMASGEVTPVKAPAPSLTKTAALPQSQDRLDSIAMHSPKPEDIPLPYDVTQAFDSSLSILASPTRGMQKLLSGSTGAQALEERSPLLMEKEYLPEAIGGQYVYDETVLDTSKPSAELLSAQSDVTAQPAGVIITDSDAENPAVSAGDAAVPEDVNAEEEDEIALLISRELSSDSLEELASRWEESRIGSLDLLDESNDGFASENTPMRPKLLTRLSDGHTSDYGLAPVSALAYSQDDEDAALDILLTLGHPGDGAGWNGDGNPSTETLPTMPTKGVPFRKTEESDRGILAEMSGYAITPKVSRRQQSAEKHAGSSKAHPPTYSILREGGIM